MADYLKGLFGGTKSAVSSAVPSADDFADFVSAPDPTPVQRSGSAPSGASAVSAFPTGSVGSPQIPYTKWYRVWERVSPSDFIVEAFVVPFILVLILVRVWGTRTNRRKAKAWIQAHAPVLQQEFASVGFGGRRAPTMDSVQAEGVLKALESEDTVIPSELLKEKSANEYITYATGRQNIAFADIKLSMLKRYNPLSMLGEMILGFFFESWTTPSERMEATLYAFDGKESDLVPVPRARAGEEAEQRKRNANSTYDGFVWAVIHKDKMKTLRDDRYDISLTTTKDHPKLPAWATVMSESPEITEAMLTPELVSAVTEAGEAMEALIITDQPIDQPKKLDETVPKKRVSLALALPSTNTASAHQPTLRLFNYFLRLPDHLVAAAHFRAEVMRRVRQTREDEIRKIRRVDEDEKADERRLLSDKAKKEKRDALLKGLTAEEQRKYLEKEREKDMRKSQKRKTMKA
ncbi:hypothetical protein LTR04_000424 [Oleoguttula sp. CCFEE 6159]|nr:hypothetical protein LTR04_000424 [Oleoguttula sp. CCFEE 6159]